MIEDDVKQTRCTTCDADHEYKHARVPALRRKKADEAAVAAAPRPAVVVPAAGPVAADVAAEPAEPAVETSRATAHDAPPDEPGLAAAAGEPAADGVADPAPAHEDGPVHRRLIRATLPRPEGEPPPQEWKEPEFTVRQPGGNGKGDQRRPGGRRGRGRRRGQQPGGGQPFRAGHESPGSQGRGEPNGNRAPSGPRESGRDHGPRQGGRKRGR